MATAVEFRVLGPLDVLVDGVAVPLDRPRPRALLGILLANAGAPVSVDRLIDQLWGDDPPATVRTSLQVHVSALRKVLGERVVTTAGGYLLDAGCAEVDALTFDALIAAGDLVAALELWRGDPYTGVPDSPDVLAARTRLTELRLTALEDRLDADLARGRHAQLVAELAGLVAEHPVRQRLAGLYLLALYRCGRTADARMAYEALRASLADAYGTAPGEEVAALARAIDRHDPTLDPPSSIPVAASRFIGRRRELEQLAGNLLRTRLLTLTGPGGAGKTRLALELARDTEPDHRDGVHVVELAAAAPSPAVAGPAAPGAAAPGSTAAGSAVAGSVAAASAPARSTVSSSATPGSTVPSSATPGSTAADSATGSVVAELVGQAFGILPRSGEPLLPVLAAQLRGTRALLVLDNCEHVIEDSARLVAALLAHCPGLRVLATSREPLGVAGEQVWLVSGLAVPEAVRLLAARGAEARRGFTIDSGNAEVAAELCRRLSGLPLAIELAAAQLRVMSLAEIDSGLGLADARSRTAPDRHRTLRAAIGWSHALLSAEERAMFRGLSVFAGAFRRDAAEYVTEQPGDVLVRLADRSLVTAEPSPSGTRYRMLELIREYAAEQMVDERPLRQRHAAWYAELAETANRERFDSGWLPRLTEVIPDLRTAVGWCLGEGRDPEAALRIASSLWWFWYDHGLAVEAWSWLRQLLPSLGSVPRALRADALRASSALARANRDDAEARRLGELALRAYRELDDRVGMTSALNGLAHVALYQADYSAALAYAEDCLRLTSELGDEIRTALTYNPLGVALRGLGRIAEAEAAFTEALERSTALGPGTGEAFALSNLAALARAEGRPADARSLYVRSLRLYRRLDLVTGQLNALDGLAGVALDEGRPKEALHLLLTADRGWERLAARPFSADHEQDREATRTGALAALGGAYEIPEEPLATAVDQLL
ncbi:BTAD domain-containing putative transcriptional regulator [Flindersiella endophytica]